MNEYCKCMYSSIEMETTQPLLFRLNVQLTLYDKLKDMYYIPEMYVEQLKPGGIIVALPRFVYPKPIIQMGKLITVGDKLCCSRRVLDGYSQYHIFYKPQMNSETRAMVSLQNSLHGSSVN